MKNFGKRVMLLDGAMGTMLQKAGCAAGRAPESYNIESPEIITDIHRQYIAAGADIITTNTFGANELKLAHLEITVEDAITAAVNCAKEAVSGSDTKIALDVGPIGTMLEPLGSLAFDRAYDIFKRQISAGASAGVHLILIETMTDLYELKAAVLAAKENCTLPVFTSMTFAEGGRTFTGCTIESMIMTMEGLGVDAIGVNCSLGPKELAPIVDKILEGCSIPVFIQPNAGLPVMEGGEAVYSITEDEFLDFAVQFADCGAALIGGCCGTTPGYISKLSENLKGRPVKNRNVTVKSGICTPAQAVTIESVKITGEYIKPSENVQLREAIINNDMDYITDLAMEQIDAGADILDINVSVSGINEQERMISAVKTLQSMIRTPLRISSEDSDVIEAALRIYNGKPIVGPVDGTEEALQNILPLVKKYGAAVVGVTMVGGRVPSGADERFAIAETIVKKAEEYGIRREDIFIDCLTCDDLASRNALEALNALRMVRERLNVRTIMSASGHLGSILF